MAIPRNITREHVLKALSEIDEKGVPEGRRAREWCLVYNEKCYPPKYVISLANKYANGYELDPDDFNAVEAKDYLKKLGFPIARLPGRNVEEYSGDEEFRLSFEHDLEDYLARNLGVLEEGLRLIGRQKVLSIGRVDLLAEDPHGDLVIIELKSGEANEGSLTQLLAYISCLLEKEENRKVRGILVAADFNDKVVYAARYIPYIKLKRYKVKFELEDVCRKP